MSCTVKIPNEIEVPPGSVKFQYAAKWPFVVLKNRTIAFYRNLPPNQYA